MDLNTLYIEIDMFLREQLHKYHITLLLCQPKPDIRTHQ